MGFTISHHIHQGNTILTCSATDASKTTTTIQTKNGPAVVVGNSDSKEPPFQAGHFRRLDPPRNNTSWHNLFTYHHWRQCWVPFQPMQINRSANLDGDVEASDTLSKTSKTPTVLSTIAKSSKMEHPIETPIDRHSPSGNSCCCPTRFSMPCKRNTSIVFHHSPTTTATTTTTTNERMIRRRRTSDTDVSSSASCSGYNTNRQHKRELAQIPHLHQIFPIVVVDRHSWERRVSDYDDDDDDDDDDNLLMDHLVVVDRTTSCRQTNHQLDKEDETWNDEWSANPVLLSSDSSSSSQESPMLYLLPQTPVPSTADPQPLFCVGWAAVRFQQHHLKADDAAPESIFFIQLIKCQHQEKSDKTAIALRLSNDTTFIDVPYDPYVRSRYDDNTYSLCIGDALRIIPIPITSSAGGARGKLQRCSSLPLQHDCILHLQFGLDAAARCAMLSHSR
jgi:hypothetical protein